MTTVGGVEGIFNPFTANNHSPPIPIDDAKVSAYVNAAVEAEEFLADVGDELRRLRVRNEARALYEAEQRGSADAQLRACTFAELAALPRPEPLVTGLLDRATYAVMPGQFGTYKTFLALGWSFAAAAGTPWGGYAVPSAAPVVYVATEGVPGVVRRLAALAAYHGVPVPDGLRIVPRVVDLGSDAATARLGEIVAELGAGLVVIDTLHQCTPGLDENSNTDMGAVIGRLRTRIIEPTGATVLVPHHTGHEAERSRGASCIEDDADTVLLTRFKRDNGDRSLNNPRVLIVRKTKDGASGAQIQLQPHNAADSLVVLPASADNTVDGFFGDDRATRARALVAKLEQYRAAGGEFRLTVRSIKNVVKVEMGERVNDRVIELAARLMKADAGQPVRLDDGDDDDAA